MTKKLTLLFFICILSALNINAEVYEGSCGDNVNYSLDTSTGLLSITGTGAMTRYISSSRVPWNSNKSYIKTVKISDGVTSIGNYAFSLCSGLTSINIPNGVTSIGYQSFDGCSGLTSVTIPNSVTSIGSRAFYGCSSLTSINIPNGVTSILGSAFYGCSSLTSINIPNGVTSIGGSAFYGCSSLTSITIPNSVTSIGESAFSGCSGLTSVTIPNSVTSIGNLAFLGCSGLTSVTIPNSVTSIGNYAFEYCSGLTLISVESGNEKYDSRNNCNAIIETASNTLITGCKNTTIPNSVTSIGESAFSLCSGLTSITIPNSVTSIGYGTFSGCSGLTSVTIPNSVTSIGEMAFFDCSGLTSVTIPNSVTSIGYGAFSRCSGLTSITIPNSVTSIGVWAFDGCSGLTSITIPNSVTSIGESAFRGCSGLTSVTSEIRVPFAFGSGAFNDISSSCTLTVPYGTSNAYIAAGWTTDVFKGGIGEIISGSCGDNVYYSLDTSTGLLSITGTGTMTNPSYYNDIPWYNNMSYIKVVEISDGVTSIGSYAFRGCSGLTSVTIPNSVTSIGKMAFYYCKSLTSITIPNSVTSIGDCAFQYCSGLTSVTIPNSVTSIGESAFSGCSKVTKVSSNGVNLIPYLDDRKSVEEYIIGNDVKTIENNAFNECTNLTTLTIGSDVESIGDYAIANIAKLEKIVCYANNVPTTTRTSFENSYIDYVTLYVPASSLDAYKSTAPWKNAAQILPLEDIKEKCATPTILFENGKLSFICETEGVRFECNFSTPSESYEEGVAVDMPNKLQVSVYAKKDGYENSDVATKEIDLGTSGIRGDVNGDGVVNMPDAMFIVNKMLNGKFPDE